MRYLHVLGGKTLDQGWNILGHKHTYTIECIECINSTCISVYTYHSCSVLISVLSVSKGKECSHDAMNTHSSKQSLYLIKHLLWINIVRLPELLFKNLWKKACFWKWKRTDYRQLWHSKCSSPPHG